MILLLHGILLLVIHMLASNALHLRITSNYYQALQNERRADNQQFGGSSKPGVLSR